MSEGGWQLSRVADGRGYPWMTSQRLYLSWMARCCRFLQELTMADAVVEMASKSSS